MNDIIFLENIKKSKINGCLHHAFFVSSNNQDHLDKFSNKLIHEIICEDETYENCNKHGENINLLNVIKIGNGGDNISKESVQRIIYNFSRTSIQEDSKKIYVIKNLENLNIIAANSLLKFLEEPANNTYAILLSKDGSNVLDTLVSRCMVINLTNKKIAINDNFLISSFNNKKFSDLLLYSTEAKNFEKYLIIDQLEEFYEKIIKRHFIDYADEYLNDLDFIKKMPKNLALVDAVIIKVYEAI